MADKERTPAGGERPVLSVLIVTWNSREDVLRCLASLYPDAGPELPLEAIVVDNASTDGTVAAIRARYPEAVILENRGNVGFPRANNQALALARGRYVLYLNPDTEVAPHTLSACAGALEEDPSIGLVGCRVIYPDGETQYECARRAYRLGDLVFESLYLHMFFPHHPLFSRHLMGDWDHRGDRDVDALIGAFMFGRRDLARQVGGLPEDVFMYHEDLSFCLRVAKAGYRVRYLGGVTITHHSGRSSGRSTVPLYLLEGEVKLRWIREAQGWWAAATGRVVFALRSLLRLALAILGHAVPGGGRVRNRYPRVFHVRKHLLQFVWAVFPRAVRSRMPRAELAPEGSQAEEGRPLAAGGDSG